MSEGKSSFWWDGNEPAEGQHDERLGCVRDSLPSIPGSQIPSFPNQRTLPNLKPDDRPQENNEHSESVDQLIQFEYIVDNSQVIFTHSNSHSNELVMNDSTVASLPSSTLFSSALIVVYFILIFAAVASLFICPIRSTQSQLRASRRRQGRGIVSAPIKHD